MGFDQVPEPHEKGRPRRTALFNSSPEGETEAVLLDGDGLLDSLATVVGRGDLERELDLALLLRLELDVHRLGLGGCDGSGGRVEADALAADLEPDALGGRGAVVRYLDLVGRLLALLDLFRATDDDLVELGAAGEAGAGGVFSRGVQRGLVADDSTG